LGTFLHLIALQPTEMRLTQTDRRGLLNTGHRVSA